MLVPLFRTISLALYTPFALCASFMILGNMAHGDTLLRFSTYLGNDSDPGGYWAIFQTPPSSSDKLSYRLKQFDLSDGSTSALDQVTSYSGSDEPQNGDLIELGFFDTDPSSTITPGTDASTAFTGEWTPLTSKLRIGYDDTSSDTWGAGHYSFRLSFREDIGAANISEGKISVNPDNNEPSARTTLIDSLGESVATDNNLADRHNALNSASNPLIGIRYYDQTDPTAQTTRYNTIMHSSWQFANNADITLFDPSTVHCAVIYFMNSITLITILFLI